MLQQRIPSVIIKLFRAFIDLPPSYYTQNTSELESIDQGSMVSLDDAGTVVANILKAFAQNLSILHRLVVEDTFFMMVRLISAKPSEWPDSDSPRMESEPPYMIWKYRHEKPACIHEI